MKPVRVHRSALVAGMLFGSVAVGAQAVKISEQAGHVSPVTAKITFQNGATRTVAIAAAGFVGLGESLYTHVLFVKTDGGASDRTIWLDTIAAIQDLDSLRTSRSEFTVVLKDGSRVPAMFVGAPGGYNCNERKEVTEASRVCSWLVVVTPDEGREEIDMRKLKALEAVQKPRKDKAENTMFDAWRFSPFTGEKLPPS